MRQSILLWFGVVVAAGCGGKLQFLGDSKGTAGTGGTGVASGGANNASSGGEACLGTCVKQIFGSPAGCKLCHGAAAKLSGSLDFETPGIVARLKDVPAEHAGVAPFSPCATGNELIDSTDPEASWLLRKLRGEQGGCGDPMPLSGMLSEPDLACMTSFVYCVADDGAGNDPVVPQGGTSATSPMASAGTAGTGKTSGTQDPYSKEPCYSTCSEEIFRDPTGCKLCHSPAFAASGLDLESPGRAARLKDVVAKHADLPVGQDACPRGDKLIDSANVQDSWMLKKIRGEQASCGAQEPPVGPLPAVDLACLTTYIECVAAY